jgi:hypothetical protein
MPDGAFIQEPVNRLLSHDAGRSLGSEDTRLPWASTLTFTAERRILLPCQEAELSFGCAPD